MDFSQILVHNIPSKPLVTSIKEVLFSSLFVCPFVCVSVSNFAQKLPNRFAWNFQGRLAMGQWTNS